MKKTRRERLRSALYPRLKKRKTLLEIFEFFSLEKCRIVPTTERGDPLGFFNIHSVGKYRKMKGGPFDEKCFSKKSLTEPKIL